MILTIPDLIMSIYNGFLFLLILHTVLLAYEYFIERNKVRNKKPKVKSEKNMDQKVQLIHALHNVDKLTKHIVKVNDVIIKAIQSGDYSELKNVGCPEGLIQPDNRLDELLKQNTELIKCIKKVRSRSDLEKSTDFICDIEDELDRVLKLVGEI